VLDTLEYLRRGGRVGAAQAWVGGALKIKPVLSLSRDHADRAVRTSGKAFDRLVEYLRSRQADGADGWCVQHIRSPSRPPAGGARPRDLRQRPAVRQRGRPGDRAPRRAGMLGIGGFPASYLR
jgi:hypothetical protein